MRKQLMMKSRRRVIEGSFSFIPHRFLREGFFECLRSEELILYFFYVMAADAQGLSYYSPKTITQLLKMKRDVYQLDCCRIGPFPGQKTQPLHRTGPPPLR